MSRRLFEVILLALPRGFRDEFGREMRQAFIDSRGPHDADFASWGGSRGGFFAHAASVLLLAMRLRVDQVRVDVRYALRSLSFQKTFTATSIITLALAFGPATAVVSLVDGVLLNPLPLSRDLDRVVFTWAANPERDRHEFPWSELNFVDHRARKQGLAALGAYTGTSATIGGTTPEDIQPGHRLERTLSLDAEALAKVACYTVSSLIHRLLTANVWSGSL